MKNIKKTLILLLGVCLLFAIIGVQLISLSNSGDVETLKYNDFIRMVEKDEVKEVSINKSQSKITVIGIDNKNYISDNPRDDQFKKYLLEHNVSVLEQVDTSLSISQIMMFVLQIAVVIIMAIFLLRTFKTKSIIKKGVSNVKFTDVAGHEETKQELKELVNFIKSPEEYTEMGATLPKGVVLFGPSGTGKTLLVKAIAGEAGVPVFYVNGSDFVQKFVGVGAERAREIFKEARKHQPCILFIDEADAVAKQRGQGNNDEREQTVNALLTEIDGFMSNNGVLVIIATNRLDMLDKAFIRPGRFDKQIAVNLPDHKDRLATFKVHTANKKISDTVDFEALAKMTIGFSGAGISTLVNEATIIAVNKGKKLVDQGDFDDAYYKIVMKGSKKQAKERNKKETKIIAWHEAGHALCTKLLTDEEVLKVTIIPSTSGAGGVNISLPEKMGLYSKKEIENKIKVFYAGRVAEYLLNNNEEDEVTMGASNDIEKATYLIMKYINDFGMSSEVGCVRLAEVSGGDNKVLGYESMRLSKKLYNETIDLLSNHRKTLEALADELIKKETLSNAEVDSIIEKMKAL